MLNKILSMFKKSAGKLASDVAGDAVSGVANDALGAAGVDGVEVEVGGGSVTKAGGALKNFAGGLGPKPKDAEGIAKLVEKRSAHRVAEYNEALTEGDNPVGHLASLLVNIEMIRYRVNYECLPAETEAKRAQFVQDTVKVINEAPGTTLTPAGTYEADVTYVNILGNLGDGAAALRAEGDAPMVAFVEDLVRAVARPGDTLAAAILDGSYNQELWEEHADRAQDSDYI